MMRSLSEDKFFRIKTIISTATFKQTVITFSGTLVNGLMGALFFIFLARWLGPASFGLTMLCVTTITLTADVGDLGINTGIVYFVSKNIKIDKELADRFLKLAFKLKCLIGVFTLVTGFIFAPFLSSYVFKNSELTIPLRIAFSGVILTWLLSFVTSTLQAKQKFVALSVIQVTLNSTRLLLVLILFMLGFLNMNVTIVVYVLMPFIGFLIGMQLVKFDFLKSKNEFKLTNEFFRYNRWIAVIGIVSGTSSRLDTYLLASLLSAEKLGLYSAANQLVQVVPQLVSAVGTVVAPKFAGFSGEGVMLSYFKKLQIFVAGISLIGLVAIPLGSFIVPILYGKSYLQTIPVFSLLLIAMLIFLFSVPIHNAIIYYYSYPKLFSILSIGNLVMMAIFGYVFTIKWGLTGMALSVIIVQLTNFIVPLIWFAKKLKG